jgi:hypothetical protein
MGGGVDSAREAGHDGKARGAEVACEPLGETHAGRRGVARADDGDHRQRQRRDPAAHRNERWGVVDHLQAARIIRLAQRDQGQPERRSRPELALSLRP